jgi:ATP-dependent DNA helicase DinG
MLDDAIKSRIQRSYSDYLKARDLKPRQGQKLMIATIARTLGAIANNEAGERSSDGHICVVEAGTGTGKTVAYLLAVLPLALALNKKVVISTATIALQEQIVGKDLPEVAPFIEGLHYVLAKGRGRYLCLSKLDRLLHADDTPWMMWDESPTTAAAAELYRQFLMQLSDNRWDGDRDAWPEDIAPEDWARVTTDHRQCSGRRCPHVRQCAFFKARERLDDAQVVVANHDLVLADLALGGGAILPDPKETLFIFDEAHHLPDKALSHFACHTRVFATSRWLGQTEGQWAGLMLPFAQSTSVYAAALAMEKDLKEARQSIDKLGPLLKGLLPLMDRSQPVVRHRFTLGEAPADWRPLAQAVWQAFSGLAKRFEKLADALGKLLEDDGAPVEKSETDAAFAWVGSGLSRLEAACEVFDSFAHSEVNPRWPMARWVTLIEQGDTVDFELVSSPVLASHTLSQHLWQPCFGAVLTSATLRSLGSFDRFVLRAGIPESASLSQVPSPFDFANKAILRVPRDVPEANDAEAHTAYLIAKLPGYFAAAVSTLVLFASRKQLSAVLDAMPADISHRILAQGHVSKQALLLEHKKRVDAGQTSVLFGLASFAEGVDLPGDYCRQVIIAKIPFAVPDDPLEAAMAEWISAQGGNPFMQMAVPDAATKLVQACGRLLRTEQDSGEVIILDRRLTTKRYGQAILASLPPFQRDL